MSAPDMARMLERLDKLANAEVRLAPGIKLPEWGALVSLSQRELRLVLDARAQAQARIAELEGKLKRLGSMNAFYSPRMMDPVRDAELLARIEFARAALSPNPTEGSK